MTIAPRSLSSLQLSLPPSSHFHPPSLPPAIPLLTPSDLSTRKSNQPFSPLHLSRGEERAQELPRDVIMDRDSAFHTSHSRVLRFFNLPPPPSVFLQNLFLDTARENKSLVPIPKSLWTRRAGYAGIGPIDGVWAVFATHEEARSALTLFRALSTVSVLPALESELEPLHGLQRIQLREAGFSMSIESPVPASISRQMGFLLPSRSMLRHSPDSDGQSIPPAPTFGFSLSSNPPNPRNGFRLGDWMCPSTNCAAHNFGRNFTCIGCGCPRPSSSHVLSTPRTSLPTINPALVPSPRFAGALEPHMPASLSHKIPHILTPSGRAFSIGGRVQDVSSDPLYSCFMFWPDNEPLPEQGQIRPSDLFGAPHPPILNTGNKGPIEHQPGDWVCKKCSYLNWRRRKVCQTCYPYAEGNGDSIPTAVQADRIKRLREALTATLPPTLPAVQTTAQDYPPRSPYAHIQRTHDCYLNSCGCSTSRPPALGNRDITHSNVELGSRHKDTIYQTSTPPVSSTYRASAPLPLENTSGRLLPSCLQDIVQSPSLSPTSTTSADLSVDEYIASPVSVHSTSSTKPYTNGDRFSSIHRTPSSISLRSGNIWQLDGEESKALSNSLSPSETSRV